MKINALFGRYAVLFFALVVLFFLYPVLDRESIDGGLLDLLTSVVLVVSAFSISRTSRHLAISLALLIPALVATWMTSQSHPSMRWELVQHLFTVMLKLYTATLILSDIFKNRAIIADHIFGVIDVYLLIGYIHASLFVCLSLLWTNAFATRDGHPVRYSDLMYYSFTNLTTLGYGDIVSVIPFGQSMAAFEAILGQLYLAVFMAYVMSLFTRLLPLGAVLLVVVGAASIASADDSIQTSRFGAIQFFRPADEPAGVVMILQDSAHPAKLELQIAALTGSQNLFVALIDVAAYLKQLQKDADECYFIGGEFERLSQVVQKNAGLSTIHRPLLVGNARGGTLAYIILTQSPGSFSGGLSIETYAALELPSLFCDGKPSASHSDKKHILVDTSQPLSLPWNAMAPWTPEDLSEKIKLLRIKWSDTKVSTPPIITHSPEISQLPLEELPSRNPSDHVFVIFLSGDGGWATLDRQIGRYLSEHGVSVIGFNSLKYFWNEKTPEEAGNALSLIVEHYRHAWKTDRVALVGFSLGADVLPFMVNRMTPPAKHHVSHVILLSPGMDAEFEVHLSDWLDLDEDDDGLPLLPELQKPGMPKILCLYGSEEEDSVCRELPESAGVRQEIEGSHHFDGDYEFVAKIVLETLFH